MDIAEEVKEPVQALIILVGNIGTGKTTTTEWLLENTRNDKIVAVSNDAITMMVGNGDYTRYNPMLGLTYREMFLKCVCVAIDAGCTVVCDNAHMDKASRKALIKVAKDAGVTCTVIDLGPGSPETLQRRIDAEDARNTPASTWCLVHQRFAKKYEPPVYDEGFDCIVTQDEIREIMQNVEDI